MKRNRLRLLESEVGAVTKLQRGESLSSTERGALRRLLGGGPPSRANVAVRIAVEEAAAYEWLTNKYDVHEEAVRTHIEAMGPFRGERLVEALAGTDWSLRNPFRRVRILLDSRGRSWGVDLLRAIGTRKGRWVSREGLNEELGWPPVVGARRVRQLEREGAVEVSPDGNDVRLTSLRPRLEAMLTKDDPLDDPLTASVKTAFRELSRSGRRKAVKDAIGIDESVFPESANPIERRRRGRRRGARASMARRD